MKADGISGILRTEFPEATGTVGPAGRLPFTIERSLDDSPGATATKPVANGATYPLDYLHGYVHGDFFKDKEKGLATVWNVTYDESILVGYRWYEAKALPVRFPFGHGLTYTAFTYADLKVEKIGDQQVTCSFTIANTGKRDGAEVAQIYVSDPQCSVPRPPQELKGFQKVRLAAGETKRVEISLGSEAFRFWHPGKKAWTVEPGAFEIRVGASSADIRMRQTVQLAPGQ